MFKKKTSQLTSKGRFLKIDSLYGAPLEKTMTRMIYWNWETAKMAKFSREATGSSSSVHTSSPQYLVIVFSAEITLFECVYFSYLMIPVSLKEASREVFL